MSVYCIIPARKGSKRVPNKNFREFCGMSMVERATHLAFTCNIFPSKLFISSDKDRPPELCDDKAGLREVMAYNIKSITVSDRALIYLDDICVCLLPCTPLLQAETLLAALASYEANYAATHEMMASVCEYAHPIQRGMYIGGGTLVPWEPEFMAKRTQDMEVSYHDAGQFYIATAKRWLDDKAILDGARPWILPRWEAVDIDTEEDWQLAEYIYKGMSK